MVTKDKVILGLKGFAMGTADIVPGVSGGTIALITEIYDELIRTISSVNKEFVSLLLKFKIKEALDHINIKFLLPLMIGIFSAIISMSKIMHYLMQEYSVYTWSAFFGLIIASIIFISKTLENRKSPKVIGLVLLGTLIGYISVSLIPVSTPNSSLFIFLSGAIAICAMILPGISGSFILLILGKYAFVTGALKAPFVDGNLVIIFTFSAGCLIGLLSFSKFLNYLLKNYHNLVMCILTGFMIGSLKKIWPWREVLESKIVRGKTHVLKDALVLPTELNSEVIIALALMLFSIVLVFAIENFSHKNQTRGVSSAG